MIDAKEWAERAMKILDSKSKEEMKKSFEDMLLFGKSKIHVDNDGTIKCLEPYGEDD